MKSLKYLLLFVACMPFMGNAAIITSIKNKIMGNPVQYSLKPTCQKADGNGWKYLDKVNPNYYTTKGCAINNGMVTIEFSESAPYILRGDIPAFGSWDLTVENRGLSYTPSGGSLSERQRADQ